MRGYDYYEKTEFEIQDEMNTYLNHLMKFEKVLNSLTFIRFIGTDKDVQV